MSGAGIIHGPGRAVRLRPSVPRVRPPTAAVAAVLGVVLLLVAVSVDRRSSAVSDSSADSGATTGSIGVGLPAPDFAAIAIDGTALRLSDLRGRPVWLTFNETWCQACRAENPDIEVAYEAAQPSGVVVIGIYLSEDGSTVTDYVRRAGLRFVTIADRDRSIGDRYRVAATPTHYFIDRSGTVRAITVGGLDPAAMDAAWRQLAGESTEAGG